MSKPVVLNNVSHKDLKIITERSARYGDNIASVLTFPFEFRRIQAHYPICFRKDEGSEQFYAATLFGFEDGENLFLTEQGWEASYIPLMMEREPFLIGLSSALPDGDVEPQRLVHINLDSPRVSQTHGRPIFLPQGGNTPYLERISSILEAIYQGQRNTKPFFDALLQYDLLESFTLSVKLNNGIEHKLVGFYTINEDHLRDLSGDALMSLSQSGVLQQAYMVLASMSNFNTLIDKKNKRLNITV